MVKNSTKGLMLRSLQTCKKFHCMNKVATESAVKSQNAHPIMHLNNLYTLKSDVATALYLSMCFPRHIALCGELILH